MNQVLAVQPSLAANPEGMGLVKRYLENARNLQVSISVNDIYFPEGNKAVVGFTREDRFIDASGPQWLTVKSSATVTQRPDGAWVITRLGN